MNLGSTVHVRFVTEEERWKDAVRKAEEGRASEAVEALDGSGVLIWWAVQVKTSPHAKRHKLSLLFTSFRLL